MIGFRPRRFPSDGSVSVDGHGLQMLRRRAFTAAAAFGAVLATIALCLVCLTLVRKDMIETDSTTATVLKSVGLAVSVILALLTIVFHVFDIKIQAMASDPKRRSCTCMTVLQIIAEIAICLLHPMPMTSWQTDAILGPMIFLRLWFVPRAVRVMYTRMSQLDIFQIESGNKNQYLNESFFILLKCPVTSLIALLATIVFPVAWSLYIVEKGQTPELDHYCQAIWFTFVTATHVGYGDIIPRTMMGRVISVCGSLLGWVFITYLMFVIGMKLFLTWKAIKRAKKAASGSDHEMMRSELNYVHNKCDNIELLLEKMQTK